MEQNWPWHKTGQSQPSVITWINLVVLAHSMLHIKFQGHQPICSGEEDFFKVLPYMGMAAIFVMWPGPFEQTFVPPAHGGSIWNLTLIGQAVSEEKMFKESVRRRPTYPISTPMSLELRWAKKRNLKMLNLSDTRPRSMNDLDLWCSYRFM